VDLVWIHADLAQHAHLLDRIQYRQSICQFTDGEILIGVGEVIDLRIRALQERQNGVADGGYGVFRRLLSFYLCVDPLPTCLSGDIVAIRLFFTRPGCGRVSSNRKGCRWRMAESTIELAQLYSLLVLQRPVTTGKRDALNSVRLHDS
jgi:hypothetical protein